MTMLLFKLKNILKSCFWLLLTFMLMVGGSGVVKGQTSKIYAQYIGPYPANIIKSPGAGGAAGIGGSTGIPAGSSDVLTPTDINLLDPAKFAQIIAVSGKNGTGIGGGDGGPTSTALTLKFPGTILPLAGTPIVIKLAADVPSRVQIQAVSAGVDVGSPQAVSALTVSSAGDYVFNAPLNCDAIRITSTTLSGTALGGLSTNNVKVYYAYLFDPTCNPPNYTTANITSILDLGSGFSNIQNAIDGDQATFSKLSAGLGVGTTIHQYVYFSKLASAQDAATVTLSIPPSGLAVGLASNIIITAYNGNTQVGQTSFGGLLLGTDLLTLLNSGAPAPISFTPGLPFNRIEVSLTSLVALATSLNIYEVSITPSEPVFPTPAAQNITICAGSPVTITPTPPVTGNELRWYSTVVGGSPIHVGNSYTPSPNLTTTTSYYIATGKIGCTGESERAQAKITVNPLPVVAAITGTTSVCIGSTTTLSTTTTGGVWSSNNGNATVSATGVVTGVTAGTSIITYSVTDANGCTGTASATVTINPLPVVAAITGTTSVCIGSTTTLSTTTTGGVWSSNNGNATVSATGVVTGVTVGTSIITYTVTNGNGCVGTVSATVTINPLPVVAAITGTLSVCVGKTTTLSTTTTGGVWSSNNGNATVSATGVVTGVTAGTSIITYTVTNGNGCVGTASATVTINPLPVVAAITGTTSVCIGNTTTLSTTTTGGVWSSNNGNATVSATGVVTGVTAGTSIITYTVTNGNGCVGTASATVTINPLPVVAAITGTTSVCIGSTTTLSTTTTGGVWSSNNGNATVSATGVVTGVTAGTSIITYTVTNGNGCVGTASATVTINPLPVVAAITGTLSVCVGKTTTLSTTTTGGIWSSNNGNATVSATGVVTGVTAGTSIITYTVTNGNGCVGTASATVTINPLPVVAAITGTTSVCIGNTTTLSTTTTGGVWSSNNGNATVSATGVVTGVTAGTSIITYTVTNGNGCVGTASATVTINPLPVVAAITGTTSVCIGNTTTLSTTTTGGVWSSNNGNATVSATGVVTGVTAGTSIITYTVTNGNGCVGTASATVTINPLPVVAAITGTTSVCIGNTTTLSTTTTGGVWSSNNGNATVSATGVVTGVTAGTSIITYTVTNGNGCVGTASATVTINPLPVVAAITGTTSVCIGNTTTLSTTTTGGVWSSNNGNVTVSATGVVTGVTAGTSIITYTVTNGNGCVGTVSATVTINPLPVVAAITGTTSVCSGLTTTLSTTTTGGVWSSNNGNATVSATGVVTGVTAGTSIITYTVTNGNGCVGTASATVTINPLPTITLISNIYSCQVNTTASLAYSATSNSPTSYSIIWDSNSLSKGFVNVNNASLPASPITIAKPTGSTLLPGSYHATLTVANGTCTSIGIPITLEIKPTIPTPHVSLQ